MMRYYVCQQCELEFQNQLEMQNHAQVSRHLKFAIMEKEIGAGYE